MADIFREIDEDLRRDRLIRLWQRYGNWLLVACGLIVLGTGVFVGWQDWQARIHAAEAARFESALDEAQAGMTTTAAQDLQVLAGEDHSGYGLIARVEAAVIEVRTNDKAGGLAALQAIAEDPTVDDSYRGLARVFWALFAVDSLPRATIEEQLKSMTAETSPWRFVSREILALADLRAGDRNGALILYKNLADDLDAPQTQRARAAEIITDLQD